MIDNEYDNPVSSDQPPNYVPSKQLKKRPSMFEPPTGKDWDTLPKDEKIAKLKALQQEILRREQKIIELINLRNARPRLRLLPDDLEEAKQFFDRKERWIQQAMADYEIYRQLYPNDPSAEFFMPLPLGRPQGQNLDEDQKSIIRYVIAERSRIVQSAQGKERKIKLDFEIKDAYKYAKSMMPTIPSYDTIRRYIRQFEQDNPALFKIITEGEDFVERELLQKKRNDVSRPNQRWQSDARDLPWYVRHNGKIYRVCLIIIYDDYSGFIIWWRLILKEERDINPALKKAQVSKRDRRQIKRMTRTRSTTFTGMDVVILLLTAMYRTGIRPEEIYTDNASQYLLAERIMACLNDGNSQPITWRHSRPGKPWGRGKVEGALGKLTALLRRIPGTYQKRNRMSIRAAMNHPELYTFEEAVAELAKHFSHLNERQRKKAPSRFDVWRSQVSLPAPSIRRMSMVEGVVSVQQEVTLDDWSVSFDGEPWEPKVVEGQNRFIYRYLADAIAGGEKSWLYAVKLDIGWKVEILLHGQWVEYVPKHTQQGNTQHNIDQAAMLKDLRNERRLTLEADSAVVQRIVGTLPLLEASSGDYIQRASASDDMPLQSSVSAPVTQPANPQESHSKDVLGTESDILQQTAEILIAPKEDESTVADTVNADITAEPSATEVGSEANQQKETVKNETKAEQPQRRVRAAKINVVAPATATLPSVKDEDDDLADLPDYTRLAKEVVSRLKQSEEHD